MTMMILLDNFIFCGGYQSQRISLALYVMAKALFYDYLLLLLLQIKSSGSIYLILMFFQLNCNDTGIKIK